MPSWCRCAATSRAGAAATTNSTRAACTTRLRPPHTKSSGSMKPGTGCALWVSGPMRPRPTWNACWAITCGGPHMANEWLRLWHDMPNDPKWRTVARVSAQPIALVQAVYMHLLVDASRNVTRGHATVTPEDLASALDVTEDAIEAILSAMQGRVLDGQYLSGWDKRQPKREDKGSEE